MDTGWACFMGIESGVPENIITSVMQGMLWGEPELGSYHEQEQIHVSR